MVIKECKWNAYNVYKNDHSGYMILYMKWYSGYGNSAQYIKEALC